MTGNPNPRSLSLGIISVQVSSSKITCGSGASSATKSAKSVSKLRVQALASPLAAACERVANELRRKRALCTRQDMWWEVQTIRRSENYKNQLPLLLFLEACMSCPEIEISHKLGTDGYRMIRLLP